MLGNDDLAKKFERPVKNLTLKEEFYFASAITLSKKMRLSEKFSFKTDLVNWKSQVESSSSKYSTDKLRSDFNDNFLTTNLKTAKTRRLERQNTST